MNRMRKKKQSDLFVFMEHVIEQFKQLGRIRCSESYTSTLNSFKRFRNKKDVSLSEMDSDMMQAYEAYLKSKGLCPNSSSFYLRNLRAVYNRAVEKKLVKQQFPFKHVYTGIDKTVKRAISLQTIKAIKNMDLCTDSPLDFARDMFLFSFYTRGMSFIDMSFLEKKNLKNGILTYRRRKTGKQLSIKFERCMQELVEKYDIPQSPYLLPIIQLSSPKTEREQYLYAAHHINRHLKSIGTLLGISIPLTLYVARHSWASIAKCQRIPLSVISEGMGHESEKMTLIYLATLDTVAVDKANRTILRLL